MSLQFFSDLLCFLVIFLLLFLLLSILCQVAVISLPPRFSMLSSSHCIDASTLSSMLVSPLPPHFLDTYSLSTSSMGCKALGIVIIFLVLWFISLSSSLVHFKNGPEYLKRRIAQVLLLLLLVHFFQVFFLSFGKVYFLRFFIWFTKYNAWEARRRKKW